ncbi:endo-1,4-beta-xylanase [Pontibacter sp. SGAir0037]|uniref:endo-1,4-beta-xylanase n=1 Tax=Pontibacter sp. SGAir0037 TaxID=2571030 RepID=UPI00143D8BC0|nr:endo-1,4-beta-xylanase [Pontibacter sp. SGAir0037]
MTKLYKYITLSIAAVLLSSYSILGQSRPIADGKAKFLGNIYSKMQLLNFAGYWNQVTPENAGKWGSVEANRDVMDWTELDIAYKLAKDNGFPFRLHVLVWGNQQPSWIENLPANEQLEEIEEWFSLVSERYPDCDFVEVVNEPINDPPNQAGNGGGNYMNALGGSGATEWDWIIKSFELARHYFPASKLMLNEYNIINNTSNLNKYLKIIQLLKPRHLIDGIGVQAHAFSTTAGSATITANLNALAATDLPIYITEMDIDGPTDLVQQQEYQRIFPLFWEHPSVQGITLWGYRPGLWRNDQRAYLITANGVERPAMKWLREYVQGFVTGLQRNEALSFTAYPNPIVNGNLTLNGVEKVNTVTILDLNGRMIHELALNKQASVHIALDINPGLYILQLFDGQNYATQKLLVK